MLPQCLFRVHRHGLIFERQMHTSFGQKCREQFYTKHLQREIGNTCNPLLLRFGNPFTVLGKNWPHAGSQNSSFRSVISEEIFPYCLYCWDRSTPGRLNGNGPLNPFFIFETSKLVVNYLSRTSRWTLIQSNQLSTFPVTRSC